MAGNAEISWPHLRMRIEDNASFAHGFRILRYTGHLGHVTSIMSIDFHFLVLESFHTKFGSDQHSSF